MSDSRERINKIKKENVLMWKKMSDEIFRNSVKDKEVITDFHSINEVLNQVGKSKAHNHIFLPSGGGLDIMGCKPSNESGLLELNTDGTSYVVKTNRLTFNRVGDNPDWWYFRLSCLSFSESGIYEKLEDTSEEEETFKTEANKEMETKMSFYGEELVELTPGEYVNRSYWDEGLEGFDENGNSIPLRKSARIINRMHNGGDFVIFHKFSIYNQNSGTYDARHNRMTEDEFYQYIVNSERHIRTEESS